MKKNSLFFNFFKFFLFIFANFPIFSQKSSGYEDCKELSNFLLKIEKSTQEHPIIIADGSSFPFNISAEFKNNITSEKSEYSDYERTDLILAFRTEEALEKKELVKNIVNGIKSASRSCKVQVIFTYGDFSVLNTPYRISGTESFLQQLTTKDKCSAICINLKGEKNTITPGGSKHTSPSWLIQTIANAFFENGILYTLQGNFISPLYRLNLLKHDYRTALFLNEEIPCATVEINTETTTESQIADFFQSIVSLYQTEGTHQWDHHAIQFSLGNRLIWIGESFTSFLFLLLTFCSIFALCEFSFFVRKSEMSVQQAAGELWYLIPLTAIVTSASFLLGQVIASIISHIIPFGNYTPLMIKLFVGFFATSFYFMMLIKWKGEDIVQATSFFLPLAGIINIYIFVCVDLSLLYLFAIEYLITCLSRTAKTIYTLAFLFLALFLPFAPYVSQITSLIRPEVINALANGTIFQNILISFAFLPFEFLWLKILKVSNQLWKQSDDNTKRFVKQNMTAIGGAVAIFAVILTVITHIIPEKYKVNKIDPKPTIFDCPEDLLNIWYEDNNYFGEISRILYIKIKDQAETCAISISGKTENPILYSDNLYIYESERRSNIFRLTLFPPKTMDFRYICNDATDSTIVVTALIPAKTSPFENVYKRVQRQIRIIPDKSEGKN